MHKSEKIMIAMVALSILGMALMSGCTSPVSLPVALTSPDLADPCLDGGRMAPDLDPAPVADLANHADDLGPIKDLSPSCYTGRELDSGLCQAVDGGLYMPNQDAAPCVCGTN